jgi:hypothetical protein
MSEVFLYDKLVILNNAYNNTIVPGKNISQPNVIKTNLLYHQKVLVNAMHLHRERLTRGFISNGQVINGKIGIIGDPAGTGKSLSVLAYIASEMSTNSKVTCELMDNSTKYFYSHTFYDTRPENSTNLIIVPHSLFNQWRNQSITHTSLKFVALETKRLIRGDDLATTIRDSSFVLTTSKCYKHVQEYVKRHDIKWNNIFIDEATSIYISPSDPQLKFQFLWFMTNNWLPLLFKNVNIIKSELNKISNRLPNIHPELNSWLMDTNHNTYECNIISHVFLREYLPYYHNSRSTLLLRNSKDTFNTSIVLPDIHENSIQCRPNITINSLSHYFYLRELQPNIRSEKIPQLFQALSIPMRNIDTYLALHPQNKHLLIKRKIEDKECVICLESAEYMSMIDCCFNTYCGKCIIQSMLHTCKCPTCREIITPLNLNCFYNLENNQIIRTQTKVEACLDIIRNNRHGKFIIYTNFDNIFYQVYNDFDNLGLRAERIENNLFSLMRTVKNFNEGTTQIIFISNINIIRGLSLTSASHLIFFHEQPSYELRQVLIHSAQRIGKTRPLQIVNLASEIPV